MSADADGSRLLPRALVSVPPCITMCVCVSLTFTPAAFLRVCVHTTHQACEAAEYLVKLPDRIRKLSERAAARKQKTKGATANFAWVFDKPVELV